MCIYKRTSCIKTCELLSLFTRYHKCKSLIDKVGITCNSCNEYLVALSEDICERLNVSPTPRLVKDAKFLIVHEHFASIMDIIGPKQYLMLCARCVSGLIALGVPDPALAAQVLIWFEAGLRNSKGRLEERDYHGFEGRYRLYKLQVLQLQKRPESYQKVIAEHEKWKDTTGSSKRQKERVAAQATASLYLYGVVSNDQSLKLKSRHIVDSIFSDFRKVQMTELHYFVCAKLIEHHTEEHLFSSAQEVIRNMEDYINKSLDDQVTSVDEAVNKVIFHRDVYRAMKMIGDDRCATHLAIAEDIATTYNLQDQIKKIAAIKCELDAVRLHDDDAIKTVASTDDFQRLRAFQHKCDLTKPYIFISYSHLNQDLIKLDISRFFSKFNYWVDFENLDGGRCASEALWTQKVNSVISSDMCKGVVVYCSPYSILHSVGARREAEWLEKNREKEHYVFLCDFEKSLTPKKAAKFLDNLDIDDPVVSLKTKTAYAYILQATTDHEEYAYYFYEMKGQHLAKSDFVLWLERIFETDFI